MLQIVLQILAIIGIILLCLLLLILLVLGFVLFVPIRYNITGRKEKENIEVLVRAGWLFRLVSVLFAYPDEGANQVKVLGIPVYRFGKAQEAWEEKKKQKESKKKSQKAKTAESTGTETKTGTEEKNGTETKTGTETKDGEKDSTKGSTLKEQNAKEAEKKSLWQKILEKIGY